MPINSEVQVDQVEVKVDQADEVGQVKQVEAEPVKQVEEVETNQAVRRGRGIGKFKFHHSGSQPINPQL